MHRSLLVASLLLASSAAAQTGVPQRLALRGLASSPASPSGQRAPGLIGANDMAVTDRHVDPSTGVTYTYLRQTVGGIEVIGTESMVATARDGRVVVSHDRRRRGLSPRTTRGGTGMAPLAATPRLSAEDATIAAARALGLTVTAPVRTLSTLRHVNRAAVVGGGGFALRDVPARLVYMLRESGGVRLAWEVSILQKDGAHWWEAFVDAGSGELVAKNDWVHECGFDHGTGVGAAPLSSAALALVDTPEAATHRAASVAPTPAAACAAGACGARYNVVAPPSEAPSFDARAVVVDPEDLTVSPLGWHNDGTTSYTITRGNNVYAYEDQDANNLPGYSPDGGASLDFDFAFDDATMTPLQYADAAITNTFFWSNHLHDVLARLGFDEASGNFQTTNTSGLGLGGDALRAEALDGSALNNANFGTPPDGQAPRMQMYVWQGSGAPPTLVVNAPASIGGSIPAAGSTTFGPQLYDITADLVLGLDAANGSGPSTTDACTALTNPASVAGKLVLVDRGTCGFTVKVKNAQDAGALGVVVADNAFGSPAGLGGVDGTITIPAVRITQADGVRVKAALQAETLNVRLNRSAQPDRTSDMDAGILAHEYGHGLSTRLTGGPANSSCLNSTTTLEQGGEGWSDFVTLMLTMRPGDTRARSRGIGTYSMLQPNNGYGIRPVPYSPSFGVNPYTYASISNTTALVGPHGVGFVWATMLWDLAWDLMDAHGIDPALTNEAAGNVIAMRLVIDGLKLQPCNPGFVDARDAILAADELRYNGTHRTAIWNAFARRGLGASATQGLSSSRTDQVEAYDLPYDLRDGLKVHARADADAVGNHNFLTYTLVAVNATGTTQTGVVLTAAIPDSSRYVAGSASNGGRLLGGTVEFPAVTIAPGDSAVRTFQVQASARRPREVLFADAADTFDAWTRSNTGGEDWGFATADGYAGGTLFFAPDLNVSSDIVLTQTTPVVVTAGTELRFTHYYETEFGYDGGVVEVSANGGPWTTLDTRFVQNGYNADIQPATASPSTIAGMKAFSGFADDFVRSIADLSAYAGQNVQVRFRAASDAEVAGLGWAVDDIEIVKATSLVLTPYVVSDGSSFVEGEAVRTDVVPAPPATPAVAGLPATLTEASKPGVATRTLTLTNSGPVPLDWFVEAVETTPDGVTGGNAPAAVPGPVAPAWLSVSPQNGTVAAGQSQQITLTYDTSGLPDGDYSADVTLYSNDDAQPVVTMPLAYEVDSALPVELVAFTATPDNEGRVLVRWSTEGETDNAGFGVELRAAGTEAWREVAFVVGAGTTSEARSYERTLSGLAPGRAQFRLRQVDLDGTVAYTATVEALVGMTEPYRLTDGRPNPARNVARLDLVAREAQTVRVSVVDVQGREVAVLHDGPVGALDPLALTVDAASLPSGVYLVRAQGERFRGVRRLTVVH